MNTTVLLGSSPNDGVVRVAQKESDAHDGEIIVNVDWIPATVALMDLASHHAHHTGNTGSTDIDVKDSNLLRSRIFCTLTWFP